MVALLLGQAEEEQRPRGGLPCASKMQLGNQTSKAPRRCMMTATRKINAQCVPDIVTLFWYKRADIYATKALQRLAYSC